MDFATALTNVLNPAALFFALGFAAVLTKTGLEIPAPLPKLFSLYLILAIGYTGGAKLAHSGLDSTVLLYIGVAMFMALIIPVGVFFLLRRILSVYDAAAMAATYGSISIVTFIVGTEFLARNDQPYGGYMVAIMSLMESPAIIAGIFLVRLCAPRRSLAAPQTTAGSLLRESFLNASVFLLLGSLLIGWLTGETHGKSLEPFMSGLFKGMVIFFLLDTGMHAARLIKQLRQTGVPLFAFGLIAPLVHAALGIIVAHLMGMHPGDALLFTLLCASASYIVAPAAMRHAVPESNPGLVELLSLGVTFPLNITIGIPLYWAVIRWWWGLA
ncbi:MAG: sodium-dependent bicarbonate transport family permease [Chthoniobacterales bacterium]